MTNFHQSGKRTAYIYEALQVTMNKYKRIDLKIMIMYLEKYFTLVYLFKLFERLTEVVPASMIGGDFAGSWVM